MPRPKNKKELLHLSQHNFKKLMVLIDSYLINEQENDFPPGTLNRNMRDVLAHLHHWHLMMLEWYAIGMKGEKPSMPAVGHTWKTVPQLNKEINFMYSNTPLSQIKEEFKDTFKEVFALIEKHSNEELFEKKRYKWTGSTSLGAYLISATSSHYDWAIKLIKRVKRK